MDVHKKGKVMRKLFVMMAMGAMALLVGCGKAKSPEEVANAWCTAISQQDLATANKFVCDKEMEECGAMLIRLLSGGEAAEFEAYKAVRSVIDGDTASVYSAEDEGEDPATPTFVLKKIDGEWKIETFNKN